MHLSEAYEARPIRFLETWHVDEWQLKVYGIAYKGDAPSPELVSAGKQVAALHLRQHPTRHTAHGVGFLSIHEGRGENQVVLDRWINENELLHTVYVSSPETPTRLVAPPVDHNSVCTWELHLQSFERDAWVRCVLANPAGPDLLAYLAAQLDTRV